MSVRRIALLVLFVVFAAVTAGCRRNPSYVATPVASPPVRIVVGRVVADGDRLYVEAQVTNTGAEPLVVDRNGVTLALSDGQVLGRSVGITSTKQPYRLEPGRTRAVHVDFRAEDFKWRDVHRATIDWSGAISVDGKHVAIAPMPIESRKARRDSDDDDD